MTRGGDTFEGERATELSGAQPINAGAVVDGKYQLLRLLGAGGMGQVFEVRHAVTGRRLAMKLLHPRLLGNSEAVRRFLLESRAAGTIESQHVVAVTDASPGAGQTPPYVVMEYLEGTDLRGALERAGRLEPARAVRLVLQACDVLAAAHRHGIVHRDLKPENLFLVGPAGGETVKVLDFGVAKFQGQHLTSTGETLGTPYYMAPEVFGAADCADPACDVYSLGVILYELLTGTTPFDGASLIELVARIATQAPPPLRARSVGIDAALEAVVLRAIAADRRVRFATMDDLAQALRPFARASVRVQDLADTVREPPPVMDVHVRPTEAVAWAEAATPPPGPTGAPLRPAAPPPAVQTLPPTLQAVPSGPARTPGVLLFALAFAVVCALGAGVVALALALRSADDGALAGPSRGSPAEVPSSAPTPAPRPALHAAPLPPWPRIPPGTFTMGSPPTEAGREPGERQHPVTITTAFVLAPTEVTQGEWRRVMATAPAKNVACGDSCPVERVTFYDVLSYCNALSREQGLEACYVLRECNRAPGLATTFCTSAAWPRGVQCAGYRLPTEAEWEYAARAGTATATYAGDLASGRSACEPSPLLDPISWTCQGGAVSHRVGLKAPNAWGLRDMLGNVAEWVWDWDGEYPETPQVDPVGPLYGESRVVRGAHIALLETGNRAAFRDGFSPVFYNELLGFRTARTVVAAPSR